MCVKGVDQSPNGYAEAYCFNCLFIVSFCVKVQQQDLPH